ncbi:LPS translocon maturation chaperone LptM [Neptunicella sp. SCSIO 80796]|uniref:LPS translocon maturation chaperone LptM n=1 Tax=Neptunicella plasticusilytica TaxID=3117012 RepID=UPI003A4DEA54
MKKRMMWVLIGLFLLTACGQKGPLFMPEPAKSNQPSAQTETQPDNAEEVNN